MGVANYKAKEKQKKETIIQPVKYSSLVVDEKKVRIDSLLSHIEGTPWTVTYFKQVITKDTELRELDISQPKIYQTYVKIDKLELSVTSPIESSYDTDTGISTITGESLVYPSLTPNAFDYFVAELLDNRLGIFKITNVDRKSHNKKTVHGIEYDMVGFSDDNEEFYNNLISKISSTYVFNKHLLKNGKHPLITSELNNDLLDISYEYKNIINYYLDKFLSLKYMTITLPLREGVYDYFLVDFLMKIIDSHDNINTLNIKQPPMDNDPYIKQPQFWKHMLLKTTDFEHSNRNMGLVSKRAFNRNSYLHGAYFYNIEYRVYPVSPKDIMTIKAKIISMSSYLSEDTEYTLTNEPSNVHTLTEGDIQIIHPISIDDSYVLSDNFYENKEGMSLLERCTNDYLRNNALKSDDLKVLLSKYKTWRDLEQFYYIPLLIVLIKEFNRGG